MRRIRGQRAGEREREGGRRERKINSEDIAGGFPYYILHRDVGCNLPLISVPR